MRVSSDNGRQKTALQHDALLAAGIDPRHLFVDKASGARDTRPGLQQALDSVRPGDCLVAWKLDRLSRSLSHLLHIITTLQAQGVAFHSLTEQMDTTTPQGAFLFSVFGALVQYDGALTQARLRAGLVAARHRGKREGRPQAIRAEKLEAILTALHAGASEDSLCRTCGVKRTTLYEALSRATVQTVPLVQGDA
jgi:DNA invertase Pin-like site-specific DNA recombinase